VAQGAGDAHTRQRGLAIDRFDRALEADDGVQLEQGDGGGRAGQVDAAVLDAVDHGLRQSFGIDLQAHRQRRDRVDRGADHFVHSQGVGPVDLVAESVVAESLFALFDQRGLLCRRVVGRATTGGSQCHGSGRHRGAEQGARDV
jgi:hypothetical protein